MVLLGNTESSIYKSFCSQISMEISKMNDSGVTFVYNIGILPDIFAGSCFNFLKYLRGVRFDHEQFWWFQIEFLFLSFSTCKIISFVYGNSSNSEIEVFGQQGCFI